LGETFYSHCTSLQPGLLWSPVRNTGHNGGRYVYHFHAYPGNQEKLQQCVPGLTLAV